MATIAVLHPGQMGTAVARALVAVGHDVAWLPAGRGQGTRGRAHGAGLRAVDSVQGCEVVVSVCPPAAAVATARALSGFSGLYVDANAISPATAREVSAVVREQGACYVDGAIVGPPPVSPGTTRLYLSGRRAVEVAALFHGSPLECVPLRGDEFSASALKMVYAAWTKISTALLVALDGAAQRLDVRAALHAEWDLSQPGLRARLADSQKTVSAKGWRWAGEMQEISTTFASVDQPVGFADAAAELFGRCPRPHDD